RELMSLHATKQPAHLNKADQVVIGLFTNQTNNKHTEQFNDTIQQEINKRINNKDFTGQSGQQLTLFQDNGQQVVLVGLGKQDDFSATA
ncbi:M17 family peptidase N-terminal domain-containing protein, partial [Klebsiella pneumoniae]